MPSEIPTDGGRHQLHDDTLVVLVIRSSLVAGTTCQLSDDKTCRYYAELVLKSVQRVRTSVTVMHRKLSHLLAKDSEMHRS